MRVTTRMGPVPTAVRSVTGVTGVTLVGRRDVKIETLV